MTLASLLAYLVVFVALPLNWLVAFRLVRLSRSKPHIWPLRDRAVIAVALALIVTVFGLVFLNNELTPPPLSSDVTKILTRVAVLALSVGPSAYWLYQYRNA